MNLTWAAFKSVLIAKSLKVHGGEDGENYYLKAVDGHFVFDCLLSKTASKHVSDVADFEASYKPTWNPIIAPLSATGNPVTELALSTGRPGTFPLSVISHDLVDRTSWYQKSIQVVAETLTTSDTLTFASVHPWWVDLSDATSSLTATSFQVAKRDGTYGKHADWFAHVYVDGVEVHVGFAIDYRLGTVTFITPQLGTVTATYWHTDGVTNPSEWLAVPPPGKKFTIDHVELQFSKTIAINGVLRMEIWAGKVLAGPPLAVDSEGYAVAGVHFPDALFGDPRVPLSGYGQRRFRYRNTRDIINAGNGGQGYVEPFGELTQPVIIMPFNYVQAFVFDSAQGTLMRIMIENNAELGGELATAAFYLTVSPSGS